VRTFTDSVTFDRPSGDVYLVIDNVDMDHVPSNTTPTGPVHVDLALEVTSRFNVDF
jgi:hypothetical protein